MRHNIASQGAKGDEEGGSVRSLLSRILGRFATSICAKRTWLLLAPFLGVVAGSLLAGDHAAVEAQQYSAYSDPEKPAIAFVLSEQRNAEEFQAEFGLDDEEMAKVLNVPIGTIRSRLHRARLELRELLEQDEGNR